MKIKSVDFKGDTLGELSIEARSYGADITLSDSVNIVKITLDKSQIMDLVIGLARSAPFFNQETEETDEMIDF